MGVRLFSLVAAASLILGLLVLPAGAAGRVDVIVTLNDGPEAVHAVAAEVAAGHGIGVGSVYAQVLRGFSGSVSEGRLGALARDPRVRSVELDAEVHADAPGWCTSGSTHPACAGDSSTTGEQLPWGVDRIGADEITGTGSGVHVYVLDTGIDSDHGDLAANLGNGYAVVECTGGSCLTTWDDDHGHGTHVAGTIGAIDNDIDVIGVAPQVTLHAVKVLSGSGSGSRSGVIAGIDWAAGEIASRGAPGVINMSLGGSGSKTGTCTSTGFTGTDSYHEAICNAKNGGAVFAVSAGNDGADADQKVPAAYDDAVITVSATASDDSFTSWSNWGDNPATWGSFTVNHAPVTIAAPGSGVLSTASGGGTTTKSGTSMSAPHVSGAIALLLAAGTYTADGTAFDEIRAAILGNAESTATFGGNAQHPESFLNVRDGSVSEPAPEPTGITLSATARKVKGYHEVDLSWSGTTATGIDVYRDGVKIATDTANDGSYTDKTGNKGSASYTYQVCEVGTSTCSNEVTVTY